MVSMKVAILEARPWHHPFLQGLWHSSGRRELFMQSSNDESCMLEWWVQTTAGNTLICGFRNSLSSSSVSTLNLYSPHLSASLFMPLCDDQWSSSTWLACTTFGCVCKDISKRDYNLFWIWRSSSHELKSKTELKRGEKRNPAQCLQFPFSAFQCA